MRQILWYFFYTWRYCSFGLPWGLIISVTLSSFLWLGKKRSKQFLTWVQEHGVDLSQDSELRTVLKTCVRKHMCNFWGCINCYISLLNLKVFSWINKLKKGCFFTQFPCRLSLWGKFYVCVQNMENAATLIFEAFYQIVLILPLYLIAKKYLFLVEGMSLRGPL